MQEMNPKILSRAVIYQSEWINLYVDKVAFPGGRIVQSHHFLEFGKDGVGSVVVNEQGNILLIHSYRYISGTLEWEIPAGYREKSESILDAAKREVREETGYETTDGKVLYSLHPVIGISSAVSHLVQLKAGRNTGSFDPNEVREIKWVMPKEVWSMIDQKIIRDGFSLMGLLLYFKESAWGVRG
ncbi:MAG: NUDIX hydrolase [Candidatus Omnitrophica bacterium]|nr:NUDIX hydrolase [Candidatus Omnitrophota bacterium]